MVLGAASSPGSRETLAKSSWWHRKCGFSSLRHGGCQMLGSKSEGFNSRHVKKRVKV
jgi:hypothetical protein